MPLAAPTGPASFTSGEHVSKCATCNPPITLGLDDKFQLSSAPIDLKCKHCYLVYAFVRFTRKFEAKRACSGRERVELCHTSSPGPVIGVLCLHFLQLSSSLHLSSFLTSRPSVSNSSMPRKSQATPRRKMYSRDRKTLVIYQSEILGKSSTEIAIDLDMDLRSVQRVRKMWGEVGEVCKSRKYKGRVPIMSPGQIEVRTCNFCFCLILLTILNPLSLCLPC